MLQNSQTITITINVIINTGFKYAMSIGLTSGSQTWCENGWGLPTWGFSSFSCNDASTGLVWSFPVSSPPFVPKMTYLALLPGTHFPAEEPCCYLVGPRPWLGAWWQRKHTSVRLCAEFTCVVHLFSPRTKLGRAHQFQVEENPLQQLLSKSR